MTQDDGDIVRGLGFVTLYSSYLEEQIECLLAMLAPIVAFGEDEQRWPISRKIKQAQKIIKKIEFETKDDLLCDLKTCKELFEDRNKLVHGRIYGNYDRPDTLKSGRSNVPDTDISSQELYQLSEEFFNFRSAVSRPMIFKIPEAIANYLNAQA